MCNTCSKMVEYKISISALQDIKTLQSTAKRFCKQKSMKKEFKTELDICSSEVSNAYHPISGSCYLTQKDSFLASGG